MTLPAVPASAHTADHLHVHSPVLRHNGGVYYVGMMTPHLLDPSRIRDISHMALDNSGRPRVLPSMVWKRTTPEERMLLGHRHGIYSFPTAELVEHLHTLIGGRSAIEVGAGHGMLAQALGIRATDSRQQEIPHYRAWITALGQPPVRYGPNVIGCDAIQAVRKYRPDVVIGCWVTHRYDPARHWAGGNEMGIDEVELLRWCGQYVVVGNEQVHQHKAIWSLPHTIEYPSWLVSRAMNGSREFIAMWDGGLRREDDRGRSQ